MREYYRRRPKTLKRNGRDALEYRLDLKKWLLDELGQTSCQRCGWTPTDRASYAAFDFHHRDHQTKRFAIAGGHNRSKAAVLEEARKCDVLCANCHRIYHALHGQQPLAAPASHE